MCFGGWYSVPQPHHLPHFAPHSFNWLAQYLFPTKAMAQRSPFCTSGRPAGGTTSPGSIKSASK